MHHDPLCIDYGLIGLRTSDCECEWRTGMICTKCGKIASITTIRNKRMCYACWKQRQVENSE